MKCMLIDIYSGDKYYCSTIKSKTCKEALARLNKCMKDYPVAYGSLCEDRKAGKKLTAKKRGGLK